jgi:hypothetical protein
MALVETQMVTAPQVFLPYAVMKDGRTLSEHVETNPSLLRATAIDLCSLLKNRKRADRWGGGNSRTTR